MRWQIRARRLAKLGSSTPKSDENKPPSDDSPKPSSSTSQTSKSQSAEAQHSTPASTAKTTSTADTSAAPNPFSQLRVQDNAGSKETASPAGSSTGTIRPSRKRPAPDVVDDDALPAASTPAASSKPPAPTQRKAPNPPPAAESDEDYANRVLSQIFRVTVDPHNMSTTSGQRLSFLPSLNEELNDSGEPLKLTTANVDQAILEAAGTWPPNKPLMDYLLPCWKRALKAAASLKNASPHRVEIIDEAKRLAISNCLFSLTLPDLYG